MKKRQNNQRHGFLLFFLFIGILLVWQAVGLPVTINITFGEKKQARAAGEPLLIDAPLSISTANYLTAQKLVDTASSTYFIDPAATGTSLMIAGAITFSDGTSQTAAASGVPAGTVVFYNGTSCPTGWAEYTAARGFTIVGLPASGTLNGTVGTAMTNLENRTHTHTGPSHTHDSNLGGNYCGNWNNQPIIVNGGGNGAELFTYWSTGCGASSIRTGVQASGTGSTGTAATSNVMPYLQLLVCQKS